MKCYRCNVGLPDGSEFCLACGAAQRAPHKRDRTAWTILSVFGFLFICGAGVLVVAGVFIFFVSDLQNREQGRRSSSLLPTRVVIDQARVLRDGESLSWHLLSGRYQLEMTASDDGATVEWIGGNCPTTQPMRQLSTSCEMRSEGQLIIKNPSTFGLGAPVSVTVKVTRSVL
jgi:hypothetical protein